MKFGEVVDFGAESGGTPGVAGTNYYSAANGVVSTTNTGVYVGHTVEGSRLIVRVNDVPAGA